MIEKELTLFITWRLRFNFQKTEYLCTRIVNEQHDKRTDTTQIRVHEALALETNTTRERNPPRSSPAANLFHGVLKTFCRLICLKHLYYSLIQSYCLHMIVSNEFVSSYLIVHLIWQFTLFRRPADLSAALPVPFPKLLDITYDSVSSYQKRDGRKGHIKQTKSDNTRNKNSVCNVSLGMKRKRTFHSTDDSILLYRR